MEATRSQEFKVGLLMIVGVVVIVGTVAWFDAMLFADYYRVTAYLENAGGLRTNSPVTLAGLRIGQVVSVRTNRDGRGAIEAVLRVNAEHQISSSSDLTLLTNGIFGDSYLEFVSPGDEPGPPIPRDGSATIIVQPGPLDSIVAESAEIVSGIKDVLKPTNRGNVDTILAEGARVARAATMLMADVDRLSTRIATIAERVEALVRHVDASNSQFQEQGGQVLNQLDAGLGELRTQIDSLGGRLTTVLDQGETTLAQIEETSRAGSSLLVETRADIISLAQRLRSTAEETETVLRGLNEGRGMVGQLLVNEELARDLNDTAITARELAERLADHPEVLIWGQTEEEAAAARRRRELQRARRAFHEGFRTVDETAPAP